MNVNDLRLLFFFKFSVDLQNKCDRSFYFNWTLQADSGKLQQFNYSRSLITNRGTVERGIGRIAKNYYAPPGRET